MLFPVMGVNRDKSMYHEFIIFTYVYNIVISSYDDYGCMALLVNGPVFIFLTKRIESE
jgi:hypothetical protein